MKPKTMIPLAMAAVAFLALGARSARAAEPAAIWAQKCAACHGKDGRGDTRMGKKLDIKDYTDAKVQSAFTDDKAVQTIKEGFKDDKGKELMKGYKDAFSDDEIKGLVAYVRALKKP
jgi:mono/diheme cytochrome c family protein